MKKIWFFILAALMLVGCSDDNFKVDNPQKETTVEIQQAAADTTAALYKLYETEDVIFIVNAQNNLVEYKAINSTGEKNTMLLLLFCIILIMWIVIIIATTD